MSSTFDRQRSSLTAVSSYGTPRYTHDDLLRNSMDDDYNFLSIPPQKYSRELATRFAHSVSLQHKRCTCIVCSRESPCAVATNMNIRDIPGRELLTMGDRELDDNIILDNLAVTWDTALPPSGYVCDRCMAFLTKDKKPPVSLASGYATGMQPEELAGLTLVEKLLISKRPPGVYVLYESREVLAQTLDSTLGLDGDDHQFSPPGIQQTLPMTLTQLKGLIRMPVSGAKLREAPECTRVRRRVIETALLYLKSNHPYYGDINISEENLDLLPESAIPADLVEHMSDPKSSLSSMNVYAHRTDVIYEHPTVIHQFSWMFPTLVPRRSGPLDLNTINWAVVSQWFMDHSDPRWKSDGFFITWLFKKYMDQKIRKLLDARGDEIDQLVEVYSDHKAGQITVRYLERCTYSVLTKIPGSAVSRSQVHNLFWSISALKSPPTFHLMIDPCIIRDNHPLSQSAFGGPDHDPAAQVKTLNGAVELIISELMGAKYLGAVTRGGRPFEPSAFGKVSTYLTAVDPEGPRGMRMHIAIWITNAPPFTVLQQQLSKANFRRDFERYCDAVFANLDARAPPTNALTHTIVAPNTHQPPRDDTLWNAHLMKAAGVEVTARAINSANEVALLSRMMAKPIRSLVPIEGFDNILSFYKPINGRPDRQWGKNLVEVNVRSRLEEMSIPEQIHYLYGGNDFTMSHHTVDINLDAIRRMLYDNFVDLRKKYSGDYNNIPEDVCLYTTGNLLDYAARGMSLEDQSFLEFCLTTEETSTSSRRWHIKKFRYLSGRNRDNRSRVRFLREVLPRFGGEWIPRLNDDTSADLHRAMLLLLCKPWRYLSDLHHENTQWDRELSQFMNYADERIKWFAYNLQFYHEAQDAMDVNSLVEA